MGSELRAGVVVVPWLGVVFLIIIGGGSFQPDPLDTIGVKPGPGWSGTWPVGGGAMLVTAPPASGVKK